MTDQPLKDLHAVGYARVSTDDKGQSTDSQIDQIKRWADAQGVILDSIFSEDISGTVWPRPVLSQALVTVATTQASILICYDQSRLTRDAQNHIPLIKKMIGDKVIRFVVNGDLDPESMASQLVSAIKGVTDSEERKVLSEKTKLKLVYKRDVLHIHVGRPSKLVITDHPEQYNTGKVSKGAQDGKKTETLVVSPDQLFRWAQQGWAPSYVARSLLNVSPQLFLKVLKGSPYYEQYYNLLNQAKGVN